jgi:hypothetical protein
MKVLFICKKRVDSYGISFGLLNSAKFVSKTLVEHGIDSQVVAVVDNNQIDKEVYSYKPDYVVIEAYWVVPSKMHVLCQKYKDVIWIVRGHSKIPFFAHEGNAMHWTHDYIQETKRHPNLYIAFNDEETTECIFSAFDYLPIYLPNIYNPPIYSQQDEYIHPLEDESLNQYFISKRIHVGCFGAIRPMKNQLLQAFSAIQFADNIHSRLVFHVNSGRVEQEGENVLRNLRNIFNGFHSLVEHPWIDHSHFIQLVKKMDIGMQVSFSESFNIVSADFVSQGVPIVGSNDIRWLSGFYTADPNSKDDIIKTLSFAWRFKGIGFHNINKIYLNRYNKKSTQRWLYFLNQ